MQLYLLAVLDPCLPILGFSYNRAVYCESLRCSSNSYICTVPESVIHNPKTFIRLSKYFPRILYININIRTFKVYLNNF